MPLHYLLFDFSDEASGHGSFDALASVAALHQAALLAEIGTVLEWATGQFGPAGTLHDDGDWDYALQAVIEPDTPVAIDWCVGGAVTLTPAPTPAQRVTVSVTLGGSPAFCAALTEAFGLHD